MTQEQQKSTAIEKYKPMTPDAMEDVGKQGALVVSEFWDIPEGRHQIRGLPLPQSFKQKTQIIVTKAHMFKFPDRSAGAKPDAELFVTFNCPKLMLGADGKRGHFCRGCEWCIKNKAQFRDLTYSREAKARYAMNVMVRGQEELGPQVWRFPPGVYDDLKTSYDTYGDYSQPTDEGYDFILIRKGTERDTEWTLTTADMRNPLPLAIPGKSTEEDAQRWIREQRDLSIYLTTLPDADILQMLKDGHQGIRRQGPAPTSGGQQQQQRQNEPPPPGIVAGGSQRPPMDHSDAEEAQFRSVGDDATQGQRSQSNRQAGPDSPEDATPF